MFLNLKVSLTRVMSHLQYLYWVLLISSGREVAFVITTATFIAKKHKVLSANESKEPPDGNTRKLEIKPSNSFMYMHKRYVLKSLHESP